jgi:hypothetical protein
MPWEVCSAIQWPTGELPAAAGLACGEAGTAKRRRKSVRVRVFMIDLEEVAAIGRKRV